MQMMKADLAVVEALPKEGPKSVEDIQRIWEKAYTALSEDKKYEEGNRSFSTGH
jgi:hypothetical protein